MIVKYTDQERAEMEALEKKYASEIAALDKKIEELSIRYNWPDTDAFFSGINAKDNPEKWEAAVKRETEAIDSWIKSAPAEWLEARDGQEKLFKEYSAARMTFYNKVERRQFSELGDALDVILEDGKHHINELIDSIYKTTEEWFRESGQHWAYNVVALGGDKWKLDATETRSQIIRSLHLHFEALKDDQAKLEELNIAVKNAVEKSPHVAPEGTPGRGGIVEILETKRQKPKHFKTDMHLHDEGKVSSARKRKTVIMPDQLNIWDGWESMGYLPMLQSPAYNSLIHGMGAADYKTNRLGNRTIDRDNITITLSNMPDSIKNLPRTAQKMLDMLQIQATRSGMKNLCVSLPLREYMDRRGIRDIKEARNQAKRDLELLQGVSVKIRDRYSNYINISLSGGTRGIVNSVIGFKYNEDWLNMFPLDNSFMPIPKGLFATNDKYYPHAYLFGRAVFEHRRMNTDKKNECTISVKTLIKASPTFPTYDNLGEAKQVNKRIIEPFEKNMDAAVSAVGGKFQWNYSGINTDEPPQTYEEFIAAKIYITWGEYPQTDTIKHGRAKYKKMLNGKKLAGKKRTK